MKKLLFLFSFAVLLTGHAMAQSGSAPSTAAPAESFMPGSNLPGINVQIILNPSPARGGRTAPVPPRMIEKRQPRKEPLHQRHDAPPQNPPRRR